MRTRYREGDVLIITRPIREAMVANAREGLPFEVCGILGGRGSVVSSVHPIRNLKQSGSHFLMDPREQIAVMGSLHRQRLDVLAFYHSHPAGPAFPSAEDVRLAFYPEVATVIVSLESLEAPVVAAFRMRKGEITEEAVFETDY
jgi:proteasome lid subunit RPN8/RPN11